MSENTQAVPQASKEDQLKAMEQVRDLFAQAHDLIAQADYPGHLGGKVNEVLNFLKFQYGDFKNRAETASKVIEAEKKGRESVVNVPAAKAAADAAINNAPAEAPKA